MGALIGVHIFRPSPMSPMNLAKEWADTVGRSGPKFYLAGIWAGPHWPGSVQGQWPEWLEAFFFFFYKASGQNEPNTSPSTLQTKWVSFISTKNQYPDNNFSIKFKFKYKPNQKSTKWDPNSPTQKPKIFTLESFSLPRLASLSAFFPATMQ